MKFNRQNINKDNILSSEIFDSILEIENVQARKKVENEIYDIARELKIITKFKSTYEAYKREKLLEMQKTKKIYFGHNAEFPSLLGGEYFIGEDGSIFNGNGNRVCYQLIQPTAIYKNIEDGRELVECSFYSDGKWKKFVEERLVLSHSGKIVSLAAKGVDVTTERASMLVKYLNEMINLNRDIIPLKESISKLGWNEDSFIPFDGDIEYDGDDNFRSSFNSLVQKGDYNTWLNEMYIIRKNKVVRLIHATSLASVLLRKLKKQSFVTMLWGTTGDGKTVAGMTAMSFWGNPAKGKLMFTLNNTDNFYYRIANFFYDLPVFFDELQSYRGDMNKLIMNITEGIDRGKARADGGVEQSKTWNNAFIMTGEQTASTHNSGGGTLNRLIEINTEGKIIEDGSRTAGVVLDNYGFAGRIFIDFIKKIPTENLDRAYKQFFKDLLNLTNTEEKQAINMAIILLADYLACRCIFTEEEYLKAEDVVQYMFSKEEIDISERAYERLFDICAMNKGKFIYKNLNSGKTDDYYGGYGEFWGQIDEYEITINKSKLDEILKSNGYSSKKTLKDWVAKGYIEKTSNGKNCIHTTVNGIKAYYVLIKIKKGE